jgi:hypothetical protein
MKFRTKFRTFGRFGAKKMRFLRKMSLFAQRENGQNPVIMKKAADMADFIRIPRLILIAVFELRTLLNMDTPNSVEPNCTEPVMHKTIPCTV